MCTNMHMCSHQWDIVWIVTQRPSRSQKSLRFFQANILINNIIEPCINKQTWDLFRLIRVNRGEWLWSLANTNGTNKHAKIYVGRPMTVHNLLFWAHTLCMSYGTKMFLLVGSSVNSKRLLCSVHGQGQKKEQKHATKNFVKFHNHFFLLTMGQLEWLINWLTGTI